MMGALTLVVLVGSIMGRVEVLASGRGILRPLAGVRLLQAQVGGVLGQVYGHNGDHLKKGQPIAAIEAAQVQGSILEADRQLALLRSEGKGFSAQEETLTRQQIRQVQGKIAMQEALIQSCQGSVDLERNNVERTRELVEADLQSRFDLDKAKDQMNAAIRQRELARQQLVQLQQELSALESTRLRQAWQHSEQLNGVQSKRDALEANLRQTQIVAPVDGFLDAMEARRGDVLQSGQTVAKMIPDGSPLHVVAFLAEKDRPQVQAGAQVRLELVAFPFTEFGTLRGRVLRIGSDLASPYEVREVLGEEARLDQPSYRVEIEVLPERPNRLRHVELQPGMELQARFTLSRQRLITLALDPLRRWLE